MTQATTDPALGQISVPGPAPEYPNPVGAHGCAPTATRFLAPLHLSPSGSGTRREYRARFIRAGRTVRADGEPGPFVVPTTAILDALDRGLFVGLASFVDHPGFFENHSLRNLAGVTVSAEWNTADQAADGVIRLYPNAAGTIVADLFDAILDDAEAQDPVPNVGLSLVFYPKWKPRDNAPAGSAGEPLRLDKFRKILSVDFVFTPAADGRVKDALAALSALVPTPPGIQDLIVDVRPDDADTNPLEHSGESAEDPLRPNPTPIALGHTAAGAIAGQDPNPVGAHGRAPTERSTPMPEETQTQEHEQQTPAPTLDRNADAWAGALQEAASQALIETSGLPAPARAFLRAQTYDTPEQLRAAIEAQRAYLAELRADRVVDVGGSPPRSSGVALGLTGLEQVQAAVEALIAGVNPSNGIRPLTGIRELYHLLSGDFEMTGTFQEDRVYLANVTCSTMAGLVANALNKVVVNEYAEYPQWWAPIVTVEDFTTLQQVKWITLGGIGELPTVAEGATYTEMTWDDQTETADFVKKGGYLGITLEAIDKDDTRRLRAAPRALAQAAWLTLSKSVSAIFTANSGTGPAMSDSNYLFDASNHGNLLTTALSWTAYNAVRVAMMKQTEVNSSERLGALTAPKFLLVPIDLEITALQIFASEGEPGTGDNDENVHARGDSHRTRMQSARRRVIVVPLWTDTNNWAAAADPRLYPSIGLGFRYGRTPEIFSVASPTAGLMFTNDTLPVKVRFFYAVGPTDWRGLHKNNVA